jgi:hypothetical protein
VPWRFSDAGRYAAWIVCHAGVRKPAQMPTNAAQQKEASFLYMLLHAQAGGIT